MPNNENLKQPNLEVNKLKHFYESLKKAAKSKSKINNDQLLTTESNQIKFKKDLFVHVCYVLMFVVLFI